jgi:REP-associated tyrosine transposase
MARPLRITFSGAFYHITSRGNERKAVFKSNRDREKFLEYLESATERYNAVIHAFCLMDNHYHLLLETPSGNLPQIMRHINGAYTTYFNVKRARNGHLFQGRYKAILVEKDAYAKELSRYIHLNPVRAKMVEKLEQHPWSSYNYYVGRKDTPEWLNRSFILSYFGDTLPAAQKGYRDFVLSLIDCEYQNPLDDVFGSVLLGSEDFIKFIRDRFLHGKEPNRNLPAIGQILTNVSMKTIIGIVETAFGDDPSLAKNATIYLCRKHTGEKLKTIGTIFGVSDAAVSQVCKRFKHRIGKDLKLKKAIDNIDKKLRVLKVET